ncbi:acyl-CoA-binding protein-like isoform X2 [Sitodiplosis mosellana]|uniref:acyl-CoA-binding protein-like isoform X2 n=1 Tax=Sitodiplosis mosellana TaxID=263140 RepID=UPI002443D2DF|nr:acyl-CoA-binding protein-like isoform X2 [Sitodiplosis mosellana]
MMSLQEQFEKSVEGVKQLATQPNTDDLLEIYALYKQATIGNVNTASPGMFDIKGKSKWNAWNAKKDMTTEEAMQKYINKVQALATK